MATTISEDTGVSQVQAGSIQPDDLAANVATTGPLFSAYQSTLQSIATGTITKVNLQTEEYDTASAFDTTTSRFQPLVAGYYQLDGRVQFVSSVAAGTILIYKNGAEAKRGTYGAGQGFTVSALVYLNGSTDYVELQAWHTSAATNTTATYYDTFFQGFLARKA